jgi:hypothetical protein
MAYRILHCGTSIENYNLCVEEKVAGFSSRKAHEGDIIYFAVKNAKESICGARAKLSLETDYKPWRDADNYVQCFTLSNLEYCEPFNLKVLSQADKKHWSLKYLLGSKSINDQIAKEILDKNFDSRIRNAFYKLPIDENKFKEVIEETNDEKHTDIESEEIAQDALKDKIKIMGTFQTINFIDETDKVRGLENLVNNNFYALFPAYPIERTVLINDNRMFKTSGLEGNESITGIRGIPDALMIVYNKDFKTPFQVSLIEYECYGEKKTKSYQKFNYLNNHIIPQLIRFASTFSIVTDKQIREDTASIWTDKIIDYILNNPIIQARVNSWIREVEPNAHEQKIGLIIREMLLSAFRSNLRIVLIIDELGAEQKETIKNVINSFKLENGNGIDFIGYIVRLEQRVNLLEEIAEYALSVQ